MSLSIGDDKDTIYTLFSPKKYPEIITLPNLHIACQSVPYTTTMKYLDVYLDYRLSFKEQQLCWYFLPRMVQAPNKMHTCTTLWFQITRGAYYFSKIPPQPY